MRNIFLSSLNNDNGDRELIKKQLCTLLGPFMILYKLKSENDRFLIIFYNCRKVFEFGLQLATFFDDYGDYQYTSRGCSVCHRAQLLDFKRYEYVFNEMFVLDYQENIIKMIHSLLLYIKMNKSDESMDVCENSKICKGFKYTISAISFVNDDSNKENTIYVYIVLFVTTHHFYKTISLMKDLTVSSS